MTNLNLTDAKIEALWSEGNGAGNGYAVGERDMTPREAAEAEGSAQLVKRFRCLDVRVEPEQEKVNAA